MELFFEHIQNKLRKERTENLEILMAVQDRFERSLKKMSVDPGKKPPHIHLIDFIKNLSEKGFFSDKSSEEIINLIDCLANYIISVRSIITGSVQLIEEKDKVQDIQEKAFKEKGEEVKVIREPEELIKVETDIMEEVKELYKTIKSTLESLMIGKSYITSLYFENVITELIKNDQLTLLSKEKLNELLYINLQLVKKWLILMITVVNRSFILENLVNSNEVEISKFMAMRDLLKEIDDRRFSVFMEKLMNSVKKD